MKEEAAEFEKQLADSPTALKQLVASDPDAAIQKSFKLLLQKSMQFMVFKNKDAEKDYRKAYSHARQAFSLVPDSVRSRNDFMLEQLSTHALLLGELQQAEEYANEILGAPKENNPFHWRSIHVAYTALGRIALRKNDVDSARKHLIHAGTVKGPANSMGIIPQFALAQELLTRGEKDVVLEYLAACKEFEHSNSDQLDDWIQAIKNGATPNMKTMEF